MSNDSIVISSRTDIETYVANENPGGVYGHADLVAILTEILGILENGADFQMGPKGRHHDLKARVRAALEGK